MRLTHTQTHGWQPLMPTHNYQTYAIRSPLQTHTRRATCAEVDCPANANGWQYRVQSLTPSDLYAAEHAGKRFRRVHIAEGEDYLVFEAGQPCFAKHRVSLDRPEFYFVGRGDRRSFTPTLAREHTRPIDWVDDMQNHFDKLRTEIEKG